MTTTVRYARRAQPDSLLYFKYKYVQDIVLRNVAAKGMAISRSSSQLDVVDKSNPGLFSDNEDGS